MSPWHNRIARLPPKEQVTGSIPVGDTTHLFTIVYKILLYLKPTLVKKNHLKKVIYRRIITSNNQPQYF